MALYHIVPTLLHTIDMHFITTGSGGFDPSEVPGQKMERSFRSTIHWAGNKMVYCLLLFDIDLFWRRWNGMTRGHPTLEEAMPRSFN